MKNLIFIYYLLFSFSIFSQDATPIKNGLIYDNGKIKVYSKTTETKYFDAKLLLKTPNRKIKPGANAFKYEVVDYRLREQTTGSENELLANSSKGQHIHFIVDNGPYQAKYDPNFEARLESGSHLVLAFLSRSFHESVKAKNAFVLKQYRVGVNSKRLVNLKKDPMLFYSRPKGTYSKDKKNQILLDFYLVNTELSKNGNKVKVTLDGNSFTVNKWQAYIIEGLEVGEHQIEITLIDTNGVAIPGPFNNSGIRIFTVE